MTSVPAARAAATSAGSASGPASSQGLRTRPSRANQAQAGSMGRSGAVTTRPGSLGCGGSSSAASQSGATACGDQWASRYGRASAARARAACGCSSTASRPAGQSPMKQKGANSS